VRIAYVYDAVHPWVTGGVEKRLWELSTRLADEHDVHWYGLKYWDGPAVREESGVTLHGVDDPPADLYTDGRRSIPEALSFAAKVARPLASEEFDVVDCQEFPYFPAFSAKLASALDGSTMFLTWHEVWDEYWYEYLGRLGVAGRLVERVTSRLPDAHIAVSERTSRDLDSLGVHDAALVPNGISLETVERIEPADEPLDVLFVGRFIKEKNPRLVVEALAELDRPVDATLVGEGPEYEAVRRRADELGVEVSMPGFLDSYEDVLAAMKAADSFVLPSRREGFGITALEALACGTPVVTLDHPQNAARDLVTDGVTGAVCDATPASLAAGIERARGLSAADCRADARPYDWDRIAERVERVYRHREGLSATYWEDEPELLSYNTDAI
jgi:glycosyltransferase involved in cell wall biosynthesis